MSTQEEYHTREVHTQNTNTPTPRLVDYFLEAWKDDRIAVGVRELAARGPLSGNNMNAITLFILLIKLLASCGGRNNAPCSPRMFQRPSRRPDMIGMAEDENILPYVY